MTMVKTQRIQWYLFWGIIVLFVSQMLEYESRMHVQFELENKDYMFEQKLYRLDLLVRVDDYIRDKRYEDEDMSNIEFYSNINEKLLNNYLIIWEVEQDDLSNKRKSIS